MSATTEVVRYLPSDEARRFLGGLSQSWLAKHTAPRGPIPCIRLGDRVLYDVNDLVSFAESRRQTQPTTEGVTHLVEGSAS